MKSSRRDDSRIYLSENERICVLKYTGNQFQAAYPSVAWRLILLTANEIKDVTQSVVQVIREHAVAYAGVPLVMTSEGWIIQESKL